MTTMPWGRHKGVDIRDAHEASRVRGQHLSMLVSARGARTVSQNGNSS